MLSNKLNHGDKRQSKENKAEIRGKAMVLALIQKKNKRRLLGAQSEWDHLSKVCRNKL